MKRLLLLTIVLGACGGARPAHDPSRPLTCADATAVWPSWVIDECTASGWPQASIDCLVHTGEAGSADLGACMPEERYALAHPTAAVVDTSVPPLCLALEQLVASSATGFADLGSIEVPEVTCDVFEGQLACVIAEDAYADQAAFDYYHWADRIAGCLASEWAATSDDDDDEASWVRATPPLTIYVSRARYREDFGAPVSYVVSFGIDPT